MRMKRNFIILNLACFFIASVSYSPSISRRFSFALTLSGEPQPDSLFENYEVSEVAPVFSNSAEVDFIVKQISDSLMPYRSALTSNYIPVDSDNPSSATNELKSQFDKILASLKDSKLSENEKIKIVAETNMIMAMAEENVGSLKLPLSPIIISCDKVPVYSPECAPIVVVTGRGLVSKRIREIAEELGKAGDFKFLEAEQLTVIREIELKFTLRGAHSIVIVADSAVTERRNWLGQVTQEEEPSPLRSEGLKRLLNVAMAESNSQSSSPTAISRLTDGTTTSGIKVSVLGRAFRPAVSFAEALLGGGSGGGAGLAEEAQLMCMQRRLPFFVVRVGQILEDSRPFPVAARDRGPGGSGADYSIDPAPSPALLLPMSQSASSEEVTYASVAAEGLLRALTHPVGNGSAILLSTRWAGQGKPMRDWQWMDQFLKMKGPELFRVPLQYASPSLATLALQRAAERLVRPGSGM